MGGRPGVRQTGVCEEGVVCEEDSGICEEECSEEEWYEEGCSICEEDTCEAHVKMTVVRGSL